MKNRLVNKDQEVSTKFSKAPNSGLKAVFHSAKKSEQIEKFYQNFYKYMRSLKTIVQYQKTEQKKLAEKKLKIFNFLGGFFKLKF